MLSAANALAGETLTTQDWLNLAAGSVQLYNEVSGGFTSSSGSPIAPSSRTLSEMAEAGDIISLTVGGYGIVDDVLEDDDDDLAATIAAINAARDWL